MTKTTHPKTLQDLMNALSPLLPHASLGEDNDGQIVVYTNLQEKKGKLVDMDAK